MARRGRREGDGEPAGGAEAEDHTGDAPTVDGRQRSVGALDPAEAERLHRLAEQAVEQRWDVYESAKSLMPLRTRGRNIGSALSPDRK